jgi:hypothetical protein
MGNDSRAPLSAAGLRDMKARAGYPMVLLSIGALALIGLVLALFPTLDSMHSDHALGASKVCSAGTSGSECRTRVSVTVIETRIDEGIHDKSGIVETKEYGIVTLGDPHQIGLFHAGEVTTGDEWRGHLVTVNTTDGKTVQTDDRPVNRTGEWTFLILVLEIVAFVALRSAGRRLPRARAGYPRFRYPPALPGLAMGFVLLVGDVILSAGLAVAGIVVISGGIAAVVASLAVPMIRERGLLPV